MGSIFVLGKWVLQLMLARTARLPLAAALTVVPRCAAASIAAPSSVVCTMHLSLHLEGGARRLLCVHAHVHAHVQRVRRLLSLPGSH